MDDIKRMGKYVSMLLRHHPEEAGVILDEHGWTDVDDLIQKVQPRYPLTDEILHQLAFGKDKQRYEFSKDGKIVRFRNVINTGLCIIKKQEISV